MKKDLYISWLKDAYAMELGILDVLERHKKAADGHAEMQAAIKKHLEETAVHAEKMKMCVERNGSKVSSVKDIMTRLGGTLKGAMASGFKDELVRNSIDEYMTEYMEIATYRSLIAAAEELEDAETVQICEDIIDEEQEAADWLEEHIGEITVDVMNKAEDEEE